MYYNPETKSPDWNCKRCGKLFTRTAHGIRTAVFVCPTCRHKWTKLGRAAREELQPRHDQVRSVFEFRGTIEIGDRS